MTKKQFLQQLTQALREHYAGTGWQVDSDVFLKNNDTGKYGVMIHPPGESITPTFYIDDFYSDYQNKKSTIPEIAEQITMLMEMVKQKTSKYETFAIDFDSCKSKIIYRLVSLSRNSKVLDNCPYLPFLDLAISFYVLCDYTSKGLETMQITNQLMEKWQVGVKELFGLAKINTQQLFPARTEELQKVLSGYLGVDIAENEKEGEYSSPILMLTNEQGVNGATVLLYDHLIQELSNRYETDYYILPSSIHEILLLPDSGMTSLKELSEMVQQINEDHVHDEDILSNHAYYYSRKENKFWF